MTIQSHQIDTCTSLQYPLFSTKQIDSTHKQYFFILVIMTKLINYADGHISKKELLRVYKYIQ